MLRARACPWAATAHVFVVVAAAAASSSCRRRPPHRAFPDFLCHDESVYELGRRGGRGRGGRGRKKRATETREWWWGSTRHGGSGGSQPCSTTRTRTRRRRCWASEHATRDHRGESGRVNRRVHQQFLPSRERAAHGHHHQAWPPVELGRAREGPPPPHLPRCHQLSRHGRNLRPGVWGESAHRFHRSGIGRAESGGARRRDRRSGGVGHGEVQDHSRAPAVLRRDSGYGHQQALVRHLPRRRRGEQPVRYDCGHAVPRHWAGAPDHDHDGHGGRSHRLQAGSEPLLREEPHRHVLPSVARGDRH
mmetsp:Transcript_46970/g.80066  ORF Transcript_46970/g.80066 Transcript_46970/m.80066 type:complete len:305 (-) Transcript_46970:809-1723(-)